MMLRASFLHTQILLGVANKADTGRIIGSLPGEVKLSPGQIEIQKSQCEGTQSCKGDDHP
jgi:hypothetical protein